MWEAYQPIVRQYSRIPLSEERWLIAQAKKGSSESQKEIVLRHIGFVIFRLQRRLFPEYLKRFGEDLLEESILVLYQKIGTYNLCYRDKHGNLKPVKFSSYIWKRIDGFILDSVKKEIEKEKLASGSELVSSYEDEFTDGVEDDSEMV